MAREKLCPKCGADITDSYCEDEPDVGINGGWYCDDCKEGYPLEDTDDYSEFESERGN